jgi:hypothetical protein
MMTRFWATPRPHILMQKAQLDSAFGHRTQPQMQLGKLLGHKCFLNRIYYFFQLVMAD